MDPVASVVDRIRGFVQSSEGIVKGAFQRGSDSHHHNPIEILKRLQREAFSDLMKLRDRQDKVERMLSFYKSGKGSPFQEVSTHLKGVLDVVGALMFVEKDADQSFDTFDGAGMKTGINARFIFETIVRQKDALVAELMTSQNNLGYQNDSCGSPLALTKLMYTANINDWLSAISIPLGAQCKDFGVGSYLAQGRGLNGFSSFEPPLFRYHGCAAGLTVKGSNFAASIAELVSGQGIQPDATNSSSFLSTFGQVTYRPSEETRLTLSGIWKIPRSQSQLIRLGPLAIPVGSLKRRTSSDGQLQASPSSIARNTTEGTSAGSIALMLESELDESTKLGSWVEMQRSSPNKWQWAVSLSDTPEDELGWGFSVGGKVEGHLNRVQLEGFLNFSLGKRASLQPVLVYVVDGKTRTPALVFRSSWSM